MSDDLNRRDFLVKSAEAAGTAGAIGTATLAVAQAQASDPQPVPPGFADQPPFAGRWDKPLREVIDVQLKAAAPELDNDAVKERHQIYCHLLMALIVRFWNGNKRGPVGIYPGRPDQKEPNQASAAKSFRYRGDMISGNDPLRVNWDRYLGHNIACIAVDENGAILDFEFNHNDFFRSSAEHAESRIVRRLYSLTDDFDNWKDRCRAGGQQSDRTKSSRISLNHVTLYTSLESCAQCSGVMSLANIKRVVYLQNDFGAFMIGNIMFNLAGPGVSPVPIPASAIGLEKLFNDLNEANRKFARDIKDAEGRGDQTGAFFVPPPPESIALDSGKPDFSPSITSFLCTDAAYRLFQSGAAKLNGESLKFPTAQFPNNPQSLMNQQCLDEARRFFAYADLEGFRGSPHKL